MGMKFLCNVEPHVSSGCISNIKFHHTSVFSVYEKRARDSYYSPSTPLLTDEHPLLSPGKQNSLPVVSQAAGEERHGCLTLCALQRKEQIRTFKTISFLPCILTALLRPPTLSRSSEHEQSLPQLLADEETEKQSSCSLQPLKGEL